MILLVKIMEKRKLKVGIVTSSLLVKTGFSNNAKSLLPYLYKTGKYELFHLNQGIGDTPEFNRFPWKNCGVFSNDTVDMNRFQTDEAYKRYIGYGNGMIEKFVLTNHLDIVIHIEDGWSSALDTYVKSKWFPYLRENFLQWTTADSLPILPEFKIWAENCPNIWFWTSFAEKALKEENMTKYGHVTTVPGCFDTKEYHPILKFHRNEFRKRNNIDEGTVLFFQLGRSQLRKLYPFTIESFAKFKKRNPSIKAKLLFHCSASEGWPFLRLMEYWGLDKSDVLFTYFCVNCGTWEAKPLQGEYIDCRFCGIKGSHPHQQNPKGTGQKTAGVDSTISNEEMSNIFGMCDASVSPFTSGGYERFNAESLLCELPLLCSDYSCGKDFTSQDFVFPLDGSLTYEVGTGFLKHVPNINTMIKFYEKICKMSIEQRKEIGRKGREWVIKTFDVSVIGKKVEEWLDSRKPIEWDFQYKIEPKNPHAPIPQINDNKQWLKTLYKEILKMEVKDDDSGLVFWESELSNNRRNRQDIENYFRTIGLQENSKLNPQKFEDLLIKNNKKNFLLVCPEAAGDILYASATLKSLRESYPENEWNIYFACKPEYKELLDGNPHLSKVLDYQSFMEEELICLGRGEQKGLFQGYCFLTTDTQRKLSYLGNHNINLPIN